MPEIEDWIRMYSSKNRRIRLRAAEGLLRRADEVSLDLLIDILLSHFNEGLGVHIEKALLKCRDAQLVPSMIALLRSQHRDIRAVACDVLGHAGDKTATQHLLQMLDDSDMWVRREAGFALAFLKDRSCLQQLQQKYEDHRKDDTNVVMALQCALDNIGKVP